MSSGLYKTFLILAGVLFMAACRAETVTEGRRVYRSACRKQGNLHG